MKLLSKHRINITEILVTLNEMEIVLGNIVMIIFSGEKSASLVYEKDANFGIH